MPDARTYVDRYNARVAQVWVDDSFHRLLIFIEQDAEFGDTRYFRCIRKADLPRWRLGQGLLLKIGARPLQVRGQRRERGTPVGIRQRKVMRFLPQDLSYKVPLTEVRCRTCLVSPGSSQRRRRFGPADWATPFLAWLK